MLSELRETIFIVQETCSKDCQLYINAPLLSILGYQMYWKFPSQYIMKQFTQSNVDCYVKASSSSKPHCYYVDSDCRIVYVQCFYKEVLVMLFLVDIPFIFLFTIMSACQMLYRSYTFKEVK
jgi:hypothetical protein